VVEEEFPPVPADDEEEVLEARRRHRGHAGGAQLK
jgi:hypothetical protein